ncbi:hypothetical protein ISF_09591 [Cordyceps fumosorosea ARSEF 2679]|uniref:Cell wall galactomannoprotein n=1 Tax=Cordyceps fumosorosea (strain ARSEF 2679) TaxID=1081104 RepID=A0A162JJY5_CORFA|nr:hypothetical protein ISF_09591 [Cordyceps fumosorosea ARSEF 2679]OAA45358.1 hypothetical protein ISF_09591 [Cordyceps fumosorosea ARSEF 2679]
MRVRALFAAGLAALAAAAATPQQIADGINSITHKMAALQAPGQSITIVNAPLIVIGQGPFPTIIAGFNDIVSTATVLAGQIGSRPERRATDAGQEGGVAVADAYRTLTRVSQATLNILIGKAGLLQHVPVVGPPVASVLRGVEATFDSIAIGLINTFPSEAKELESNANSLGATLDLAIQKYEGLQV